jgi:hypothetical protein
MDDDVYVGMNDLNLLWTLYYVCDELYVIVMNYVIVNGLYVIVNGLYNFMYEIGYKLKYGGIWEP